MILSIDYGKARIGLAISEGILAQPYATWKNESWKKLVAKIAAIPNVNTIVIGLPLNADGTESKMCEEVRNFAKVLTGYEIVLFDERYSSLEAESINRNKVDQTAACVILQRYIDKGAK